MNTGSFKVEIRFLGAEVASLTLEPQGVHGEKGCGGFPALNAESECC